MQAIKSFSDIRVGHVLKALLAVLVSGFVFLCMWMGEMAFCLLVARILHLTYDVFPNPMLNELCGNFILMVLPLIGSIPMVALVWEQFYGKKS